MICLDIFIYTLQWFWCNFFLKKSQILFETFLGDGPESVVECGEVGHETITIDDTIVEKESSEDSDSVIIVHDDDDESVQVLYFCKIVRFKLSSYYIKY